LIAAVTMVPMMNKTTMIIPMAVQILMSVFTLDC